MSRFFTAIFRFGLIFTRFVLIIQLFFLAVKIIAEGLFLLPKFKKYATIKRQNVKDVKKQDDHDSFF